MFSSRRRLESAPENLGILTSEFYILTPDIYLPEFWILTPDRDT